MSAPQELVYLVFAHVHAHAGSTKGAASILVTGTEDIAPVSLDAEALAFAPGDIAPADLDIDGMALEAGEGTLAKEDLDTSLSVQDAPVTDATIGGQTSGKPLS